MTEDKLRILRVVQSTYPEVIGGIGVHVHEMSRIQAEMGHDVTVLTTDNGEHNLPRIEHRDGYKLIRHREIIRPVDNSIVPSLLKTLYEKAPEFDIIHAHSHLYFSSNLSAIASKLTNTKLVITNHGLFSQTAPMSIQKIYLRTLGKFTFESADRIFCYTPRAEDLLHEHNIGTQTKIISNGINCSTFSPKSYKDRSKQILFVGRLKPGKRPDTLVRAFSELANAYPQYQLKFVGDGPMRDDLRSLCSERGISDRVHFVGELPYEEMPSAYNQSDFLVLPTKTEAAIPRVVMESWACKTPAIMTNIQEVDEEVFEKAGLLCDGSSEEFHHSMQQLIEDEDLRRELGEKGRELVRDKFSWSETVQDTTNEYYEVLNE